MGPDMRWNLSDVRYKSTSLLCACKNIWRRHPEQGECWCEEGWGKLPGSSKCSQQSTQASCPEGQIVRETGRFFAHIKSQICCYRSTLHKTGHSWGSKWDWKWEKSAGKGETQILWLYQGEIWEIVKCFKVFKIWTFVKVETLKQIHCGQPGSEECCKILQGSTFENHSKLFKAYFFWPCQD